MEKAVLVAVEVTMEVVVVVVIVGHSSSVNCTIHKLLSDVKECD